ncbi:MAG: phosphatidylinositol mannoside acyltransferase [Sporichthyaceae bacterium]
MTLASTARPPAPRPRTSLAERAVAPAYLLGWRVVRRLPEPVADRAFAFIADRIWARRGRGVVQLERNLARVLGTEATDPRVRELSRAGMRSYLRYWSESFRLPSWTPEQVAARVAPEGIHHLQEQLDVGVGVVLALPHCGNWDLAGAWMTGAGYPFTTVAEKLKPAALFEAFVDYRVGLGMEVLALEKNSGSTVLATLAARLRDGKIVCLVADRDLTEAGVEVDFFGAKAKMPAGPAALSVGTGAALVPTTLSFDGKKMRLRMHPRIEQPTSGTRSERIAAMTQQLADVFGREIAAHPQDWHMLQRIWPDDARLRHVGSLGRTPAES